MISIVAGHVIAVCRAHRMALRVFADPRLALKSELPLLALMIAYTLLSLWIIAQPTVSS